MRAGPSRAAILLGVSAIALVLAACGSDPQAEVAVLDLDLADCPPGSVPLVGSPGPDVLVGTPGNDCIFGLGGDDIIDGGNGDDFIVGGDGSDTLSGGNGTDQIFGDDGDDTIAGDNGPDVIDGGAGNDILSGDNGADRVSGGDGNDVILDSRGPDVVDGGPGTGDSCTGSSCELPPATACAAPSDCAPTELCVGGACVRCHPDSQCDDGIVCSGVESCIPVVGCQPGVDLPEGYGLGITCTAGVGACLAFGGRVCDGDGDSVCNAVPGTPVEDLVCDAIDADCNGTLSIAPVPSTCGVGACASTGTASCFGGFLADTCVPSAPGAELCDGADNDCNGVVDDGAADTDGDTVCDALDPCPFHADPTLMGDGDIITGTMFCNSPDRTTGTSTPLPLASLAVSTVFGGVNTDCNGVYRYLRPTGSADVSSGPIRVAFAFQGTVPGPGGIGSIARVVDDLGHPWGTDSLHGFPHDGYAQTTTSFVRTDASGRRIRTVAPILINTSECELYRIAVMVADDYQRARAQPLPGHNMLSYMRRAGLFSDSAIVFTPYDYVEMYSDVLENAGMNTPARRERTLFHESGHALRHIMDGDHFHWDFDLVRFRYGRCHMGTEISEEGYAFNEGWANYWQRARWAGMPMLPFNTAPPFAARFPVVNVDPMLGAVTTTDYCDDGTIGGRGVSLTPDHLDWVEDMVADRLLFLANTCAGTTPDAADDAMHAVLEANRGSIHTLFEFETALCATGVCCGTTRTTGPIECPPGFNDDGETCSREGHIIQERPAF